MFLPGGVFVSIATSVLHQLAPHREHVRVHVFFTRKLFFRNLLKNQISTTKISTTQLTVGLADSFSWRLLQWNGCMRGDLVGMRPLSGIYL